MGHCLGTVPNTGNVVVMDITAQGVTPETLEVWEGCNSSRLV